MMMTYASILSLLNRVFPAASMLGLYRCRVDDQPQFRLMLAGNPVSRTGDQIEVHPAQVAKDILQRRLLWSIVGDARHPEMQGLAIGIGHLDIVPDLHIAQSPEHRRRAPGAI